MDDSVVTVTVVCICHNQSPWVREALDSVMAQAYPNLQLIVVDDGSTDGSQAVIREWSRNYPEVMFIEQENLGNCTAFNKALALANGKYIIDLAADDIMLPEKLAKQVAFFEVQSETTGLVYSDANYIDPNGAFLYKAYRTTELAGAIPKEWAVSGHVFEDCVRHHFIATPTIMYRTSVLQELGGFDESLAYEDWDITCRITAGYEIAFQDSVLMAIRKVPKSLGSANQDRRAAYLESTARICRKLIPMCATPSLQRALSERTRYELRSAWRGRHFRSVLDFQENLRELRSENLVSQLLCLWARIVLAQSR
jgi:glycosyltransferase involved in cell wall biosynthesis